MPPMTPDAGWPGQCSDQEEPVATKMGPASRPGGHGLLQMPRSSVKLLLAPNLTGSNQRAQDGLGQACEANVPKPETT